MGLTMCIGENIKIKKEIINHDIIEQIPNEKSDDNNNKIKMIKKIMKVKSCQ